MSCSNLGNKFFGAHGCVWDSHVLKTYGGSLRRFLFFASLYNFC